MNLKQAIAVSSLFDLPQPIGAADFPEKGNINRETYLICAGPANTREEYILQKLNQDVFKEPANVMQAMISCIETQQKAISDGVLHGDDWEIIRLIPTKQGRECLETTDDAGRSCWRMMSRIRPARSYKSLQEISDPRARLQIAGETGRGLALFGALTAEMNPLRVQGPLPGYRDTGLYYDQLLSVLDGNRTEADASRCLPANPELRQSTREYFLVHREREEYRQKIEDPGIRRCIELALEQRPYAMKLARGLETGELRRVIVHGDPKLENFLFSERTGKAIALVDLDTIMPHTWLSDWGDMARSLINAAGERETDLSKVAADSEIFESAARGFVCAAHHVSEREVSYMVDSVQIMSLELGVRFLADYLRGDNYFRLSPSDPPDLNRTRALVQFRLFEDIRSSAVRFEEILADCLGAKRRVSRG